MPIIASQTIPQRLLKPQVSQTSADRERRENIELMLSAAAAPHIRIARPQR
jgi:hypothetical protein